MLYDVFRAYGDALTVATLQGLPVTPVERHPDGDPAARPRRPLRRLIAEWAKRAWRPRAQAELCGCG